MTAIIAACIVFAVLLVVAFRVDRLIAAIDRLDGTTFAAGESCRHMEREHNRARESMDKVLDQIAWLPMPTPPALPPVDEEPTQAGKSKRKRNK